MIRKFNSVLSLILGEKGHVYSERYFVTMMSFISSIFLIFLCFFHIIMGLKTAPVYIAAVSSIICLIAYYIVRFTNCLYIPKLILTGLGLLLLDFTWYSKFLSLGPVLFFIFAFGALIIWVWEGWCLVRMLLFYYFNLAVLFFIEYLNPGLVINYPDMRIRTIDIYLSFFLYSILLIFVLYKIKRDFLDQKEKAIRSEKMKTAFLANMSHEIRTPMNAILGFSQLLENETTPEDRIKYLKIVQNSGENLLRLINEIIDLSIIEAGDIRLRLSSFNIKELFIELKEIFAMELQKKNKSDILIDFHLPEGDYNIYSDLFRVKQILSNLLNNAIKHTTSGTVSFSCQKERGDFIFSVTDTGTGIPDEDQKRIFDRFTRFNYHEMNSEGIGIGLSIVEKIVKMLNGRIWLKSEWGKGSSFYFSLPVDTEKSSVHSIKAN